MDEHKTTAQTEAPEKIDLIRLLDEFGRVLLRLFWLPLLLAVLAGVLMGLRAWRSYTPMYACEATFTIQTQSGTSDLITGSTGYYDQAAAEQLANTFPYLIQSDLMQNTLQEELGVSWLNGSIVPQAVPNTNLFSLRVTSNNPQDAYDILNAVITAYPKVANYVIGNTSLTLLAPPELPTQPYNSLSLCSPILKGAVLGLILGLGVVLLLSMTRKPIRTREEIKERLNTPCLGVLPAVTFKRRSGAFDRSVTIQNPRISSAFQESVRSLRIRLLRDAEEHQRKVYLVSSTLPGEGKTTVSINLALTLSRNGARVILVDLDLRKPSVRKELGLTGEVSGVGELLRDRELDIRSLLVPLEGTNIRLLAGTQPAQSLKRHPELRRLSSLLRELRDEADFILLDTPPTGLLGDSAALASLADGLIYVVRAGAAQTTHIMDSLQFLSHTHTPLAGCVLNGAQQKNSRYGYGYGYQYGHGYRHYGHRNRDGADDSASS